MFLTQTKSDSPPMLQIALLLILAVAGRPLLYACLGYADYFLEQARKNGIARSVQTPAGLNKA